MSEGKNMRTVYLKCTSSNNPDVFRVGKRYPVEVETGMEKTVYATGEDGSRQPIATACLTQGANFWFIVA